MGEYGDAKALWRSASDLKERFNRDWWDDEQGSIVLALDPDKRQVRAVTSNVGHCITCGIISDEHLPRVVGRMFAPDMFSGWGIRTLSSTHRAYNPLSYHLGTVWAVEQATIAFGLRRFGFDTRALEIAQALFDLAELYPEYRIPECIGGYPRGETARARRVSSRQHAAAVERQRLSAPDPQHARVPARRAARNAVRRPGAAHVAAGARRARPASGGRPRPRCDSGATAQAHRTERSSTSAARSVW